MRMTTLWAAASASLALGAPAFVPSAEATEEAAHMHGEPTFDVLSAFRGAFTVIPGQTLRFSDGSDWTAPTAPGTYHLPGNGVAFVVVPRSEAASGTVRGYRVGYYPPTRGTVRGFPPGFIEVTDRNRKVPVSRHFKLGDFACKDGAKRSYIMLSGRLLEKLENVIAELNTRGIATAKLRLMSAYRTPRYNSEIGNRTSMSRHTYGDAADVLADDFDRDGQIGESDARVLYSVIEKLDQTTPLRGGASLYKPTGSHGWFVHTDTRGVIKRW
jgi:hypothetical protein